MILKMSNRSSKRWTKEELIMKELEKTPSHHHICDEDDIENIENANEIHHSMSRRHCFYCEEKLDYSLLTQFEIQMLAFYYLFGCFL